MEATQRQLSRDEWALQRSRRKPAQLAVQPSCKQKETTTQEQIKTKSKALTALADGNVWQCLRTAGSSHTDVIRSSRITSMTASSGKFFFARLWNEGPREPVSKMCTCMAFTEL